MIIIPRPHKMKAVSLKTSASKKLKKEQQILSGTSQQTAQLSSVAMIAIGSLSRNKVLTKLLPHAEACKTKTLALVPMTTTLAFLHTKLESNLSSKKMTMAIRNTITLKVKVILPTSTLSSITTRVV
jgi:hypothetical protein